PDRLRGLAVRAIPLFRDAGRPRGPTGANVLDAHAHLPPTSKDRPRRPRTSTPRTCSGAHVQARRPAIGRKVRLDPRPPRLQVAQALARLLAQRAQPVEQPYVG